MPTDNLERLINAALSGCKHSSWVAALSDGRGIKQILCESTGSLEQLETIIRAEHNVLVRHAGSIFVARTRGPLGQYAHGVTLSCSSESGWRLLVVVLRGNELGRFAEPDLEVLDQAASVIAQNIGVLFDGASVRANVNLRSRNYPAFFVVALDYTVDYSSLPDNLQWIQHPESGVSRLSPLIDGAVRELTSSWSIDDPSTLRPGTLVPSPTVAVRALPLKGPRGLRIGVVVEPLRMRDTIGAAARKFGLSPRELDVLGLLLEGRETPEVARVLHIAPSTATHHVKRMLAKTSSRNRAELVARALGWHAGRKEWTA